MEKCTMGYHWMLRRVFDGQGTFFYRARPFIWQLGPPQNSYVHWINILFLWKLIGFEDKVIIKCAMSLLEDEHLARSVFSRSFINVNLHAFTEKAWKDDLRAHGCDHHPWLNKLNGDHGEHSGDLRGWDHDGFDCWKYSCHFRVLSF